MTNSWRSSVREFLPVLAVALSLAACVVGCGPKDGRRELEEGRAALEAGDFKRAEKLLTRSETLSPTNADVEVSLARVKLALGELAEAKRHIVKAESMAGGDVDVRLLGAQIAWHAKDYVRAIELFRAVADDTQLTEELRSQGLAGLGIVQMTCDERELARVSFMRALAMDRRNASAHYHLALLYRDPPFGYLEAALEHFDFYVHLSPEGTKRVQTTQRVLMPELKDAIAQATASIPGVSKRNSAVSTAALAKADAAFRKKNYAAAVNGYQEALKADPLSYPAAYGLAEARMASERTTAGRKKALENYHQACKLRASAVSTFIKTGALAERLNCPLQAREAYSRAVAANPRSLDALDGLIRALTKAGVNRAVVRAYQSYRDSIPVRK